MKHKIQDQLQIQFLCQNSKEAKEQSWVMFLEIMTESYAPFNIFLNRLCTRFYSLMQVLSMNICRPIQSLDTSSK